MERGPENMDDAELLAVLLRTGSEGESTLELARRILEDCGSLTGLFGLSCMGLQNYDGIGPGKACTVQAAIELGRRFMKESVSGANRPIMNDRMLYDLMLPQLKGLSHEECWLVYLNSHNCMLRRQKLTVGGDMSTVVDVRQVARKALENKAIGIFLVHNHPSGDPMPSNADVRETDALRAALDTVGVRFIDHVIICDSAFYSFADQRYYSK